MHYAPYIEPTTLIAVQWVTAVKRAYQKYAGMLHAASIQIGSIGGKQWPRQSMALQSKMDDRIASYARHSPTQFPAQMNERSGGINQDAEDDIAVWSTGLGSVSGLADDRPPRILCDQYWDRDRERERNSRATHCHGNAFVRKVTNEAWTYLQRPRCIATPVHAGHHRQRYPSPSEAVLCLFKRP